MILVSLEKLKTGGKRTNGIIVEGNTLTIGHTKITVKYPINKIEKIDGKLYATDFWGRKFNVDTENGELIDVKIVR